MGSTKVNCMKRETVSHFIIFVIVCLFLERFIPFWRSIWST